LRPSVIEGESATDASSDVRRVVTKSSRADERKARLSLILEVIA
jgi:hypothetical protein